VIVPTLPQPYQDELAHAVALLPGDGPLPVVLASGDHAPLLENWIRHTRAVGIQRFLVVAMDNSLAERVMCTGAVVARCGFDGSRSDFWLQRLLVLDFLVRHRVDIIHSDTDAIWLRDPIPEFFAGTGFDLAFSQGVALPPDVLHHWGFVLCCGLFGVKATDASMAFFSAMVARAADEVSFDDQEAANRLLCESGVVWSTAGHASYRVRYGDYIFTCYPDVVDGTCAALGLRVRLLPHHLFPRLTDLRENAFVVHPLTPNALAAKIPLLRKAGFWMLGDGA
jgi:hypothetical protein